jgi:hypothetical protein
MRIRPSLEELRPTETRQRLAAAAAVASAGLVVAGVFGPWFDYHDGRDGLDLARYVGHGHEGWLVLASGAAALLLAPLVSSPLVGAAEIVIGMVAAASALAVRARIDEACPYLGVSESGFGLFCLQPSVGWGVQLATVGALGLFAVGLASVLAAARAG